MTEPKKENDVLSAETIGEGMQKKRWRRRRIICCCGSTVAVLILIVLICVILGVTVLKAKDPKMTVNSMKLDQFQFKVDPLGLKVDLNISLDLNVSVKNRNKASFKFGNSTTELYYRGKNVGEAFVPAGKVLADRTVKLNTTVKIDADRVISDSHLLPDFFSGVFPVSTATKISGRVNFLNIFKHHAVASSYCNITIIISNGTIQNEQCSQSVKL